jgi:hypothetical protein
MKMTINPENIAQHLTSFGYQAKAGTITDKKTGEPQPVVFVNGLGKVNAYLNLSSDPDKFGLKVFGNLEEGYAPVVLDSHGGVVRENVTVNGKPVNRAKRGEPLSAEALKRKNTEISISARKEISAAVLAAYMLEVGGGDLQLIKDGFRLQKWERSGQKSTAEHADSGETDVDASARFNEAAEPADDATATAVTATATSRKTRGPKTPSL